MEYIIYFPIDLDNTIKYIRYNFFYCIQYSPFLNIIVPKSKKIMDSFFILKIPLEDYIKVYIYIYIMICLHE